MFHGNQHALFQNMKTNISIVSKSNKSFGEREARISYENNVLLNKMMEIQLKSKLYKTKNYLSQVYPDGQGSLVENYRKG